MFLSLLMPVMIACGILVSSPSSTAQKCPFETPVQTLKRATMVFTGRAAEVTESGDTQTVTLTVTKYWKGARGSSVTLINGVDSEAPFFRKGHSYLVFAWLREGAIRTGHCSGTLDIAHARKAIRELNRWQARHPSSRY